MKLLVGEVGKNETLIFFLSFLVLFLSSWIVLPESNAQAKVMPCCASEVTTSCPAHMPTQQMSEHCGCCDSSPLQDSTPQFQASESSPKPQALRQVGLVGLVSEPTATGTLNFSQHNHKLKPERLYLLNRVLLI
jgi:hypothetical protein